MTLKIYKRYWPGIEPFIGFHTQLDRTKHCWKAAEPLFHICILFLQTEIDCS